jgi:hypothetical protein
MAGRGSSPDMLLWSKVRVLGLDECWPWIAPVRQDGFGRVTRRVNGKQKGMLAHRMAYTLLVGPIPENAHTYQTCENKKCCNPMHLSVGGQVPDSIDSIPSIQAPILDADDPDIGVILFALRRCCNANIKQVSAIVDFDAVTVSSVEHCNHTPSPILLVKLERTYAHPSRPAAFNLVRGSVLAMKRRRMREDPDEFAERFNASRGSVKRIETGQGSGGSWVINRACIAYGTTPEQLQADAERIHQKALAFYEEAAKRYPKEAGNDA